ncbi:MAG: Zn-dependent oligopeptidase [Elusimicrobia bacterium]|nr:Zn-dependent oligopeptidase [Elusimicrobiota bacterium]
MTLKQFALSAALALCAGTPLAAQNNDYKPVGDPPKFDLSPEQIARTEISARETLEKKLSAITGLKPKKRTFTNTVAALDAAVTDYDEAIEVPTFLAYVSQDPKVREAASALELAAGKYSVDLSTRRDLYDAVKQYADANPKLNDEDAALLARTLKDFQRAGLALPDDQLAVYKDLKKQLVETTLAFEKNLRDSKDTLEVTREQLAGLPEDYVQKLQKTPEGKYIVTMDYPDYFPFMQNALDDSARKALEFKFNSRCAKENVALMEKALALREQIAQLLGYKTHADYVLDDRMAKTPQAVYDMLYQLTGKLKAKGRAEMDARAELKHAADPSAFALHEWDWRYWDNQFRKNNLNLDEEKIKEYFPVETVMSGMLGTFEKVFSVKFAKAGIPTWHPDVTAYEIVDAKSGDRLAYFYLDLYPRDGKYKHAACFGLMRGRLLGSGRYQRPSAAIVANFPKPSADAPSLLKHSDVVTLFHEFGHVMHNVFTQAKYGRFAGTKVLRDFVEAPSKMAENWAWNAEVLKAISGHYKNPSEKLPDELIAQKIAAKNAGSGMAYLRQSFFSLLDMKYHTLDKPDTTGIYNDLSYEIRGIPMSMGTVPQASFGHLMGGYDAGYYGYLWAEVIAEDLFSRFENEGVLNPETGMQYRQLILAPGGTYDPSSMVEKFLGRKVSQDAFLKSIGL